MGVTGWFETTSCVSRARKDRGQEKGITMSVLSFEFVLIQSFPLQDHINPEGLLAASYVAPMLVDYVRVTSESLASHMGKYQIPFAIFYIEITPLRIYRLV